MQYAVTIGTTSCRAIRTVNDLNAEIEVLYEGELYEDTMVVWDSELNNIRPKNAADLHADLIADLRLKIDTLTSIKIAHIFGFTEKCLDLTIKQINLNTQIDYLKDEALHRTLTPGELAVIAIGKSYFERIMAIRIYGKTLANTLTTADPTTIDITVGWPE